MKVIFLSSTTLPAHMKYFNLKKHRIILIASNKNQIRCFQNLRPRWRPRTAIKKFDRDRGIISRVDMTLPPGKCRFLFPELDELPFSVFDYWNLCRFVFLTFWWRNVFEENKTAWCRHLSKSEWKMTFFLRVEQKMVQCSSSKTQNGKISKVKNAKRQDFEGQKRKTALCLGRSFLPP